MSTKVNARNFSQGEPAGPGQKRGSKWHPELLRNKKAPGWDANAVYRVNSHVRYLTDSMARVILAVGCYLMLGSAPRHRSQGRMVGKLVYAYGDVGGHLIPCFAGGTGHAINLVPLNTRVNGAGGAWGRMEAKMRKWMANGEEVHMAISLRYNNDTVRPSSFDIELEHNGTIEVMHIENEVPQTTQQRGKI
jgi:hypothetical protein